MATVTRGTGDPENGYSASTGPQLTPNIPDPTKRNRWLNVHPNYITRTETSEILAAISTLR